MFICLNFCFCALLLQTKTSIALLYDEVSENAYDIRLKLTKEVLTIQKQDVVCVSGSDHSANVSASISLCFRVCTLMSSAEISLWYWVIEIHGMISCCFFVHTYILAYKNFLFVQCYMSFILTYVTLTGEKMSINTEITAFFHQVLLGH